MGKAILLTLIAIGANVNAEDMVAEVLLDRASNTVIGEVFVDMDTTTHAKPAKASGGVAKTATRPQGRAATKNRGAGNRRGAAESRPGTFTAFAPKKEKTGRLFGGVNTKTNPNADMARLRGKAVGMYGLQGKANDYGGPLAWDRFGMAPKGNQQSSYKKPAGVFTPIAQKKENTGRLFGGTNTKNNPKADMAILKGKGKKLYGMGQQIGFRR
jgi:hypothetical protein